MSCWREILNSRIGMCVYISACVAAAVLFPVRERMRVAVDSPGPTRVMEPNRRLFSLSMSVSLSLSRFLEREGEREMRENCCDCWLVYSARRAWVYVYIFRRCCFILKTLIDVQASHLNTKRERLHSIYI